MVKCICVRGSLLLLLATVLVLWQRAVNRQPGYRSGNSKGRSPTALIFQKIWNFQKKTHHFSTFSKSSDPIELWNFKVIFIFQYHFYKLKHVLHNNPWIHKHLHHSRHLQKLLFHGQEYRRAAAPSGPLSYGNERWTVNLVTARETRRAGAPPVSFSREFENFKKITPNFNFFEKSGTDRTLKF